MQTKQAIQTSANVIRITSIAAGDVYKRFDESYDDRTYFGVVKCVHNDGEKTIIEATEYCYKYSSLEVSHKVLRGEKDYILFPAMPEEFNLDLASAKKEKLRAINDAEDSILKNKKIVGEIDLLLSGEMQKNLKNMSYQELTQSEFNQRKALI